MPTDLPPVGIVGSAAEEEAADPRVPVLAHLDRAGIVVGIVSETAGGHTQARKTFLLAPGFETLV